MPLSVLSEGAQQITLVPISFQFNGTSDPTALKGFVRSVTRSDTGLFTVNLPCGFPDIPVVCLGVPMFNTKGGAGTTGIKYELASIDATAGTIGLRLINDGTTTLVDLAANANNRAQLFIGVDRSLYGTR